MKRIINILKKSFNQFVGYRSKIIFSTLLKLIVLLLNIIIPYYTAGILSSVVNLENELFGLYVLILSTISVLKIILNYYVSKIDIYVSKNVNVNVKKRMVKSILNSKPEKIHTYGEGKIYNILISDTLSVTSYVYSIFSYFSEVIAVVVSGIILIKINIVLALLLLCFFPVIYYINNKFGTLKSERSELHERTDFFAFLIKKIIEYTDDIKSNQAYIFTEKLIEDQLKDLKEKSMWIQLKVNFISKISKGINIFSDILIIVLGGVYVLGGNMSVQNFFIFNSYSKYFSSSLYKLSTITSNLQQQLVSAERYFELIEMLEGEKCETHRLEVEGGDIVFENVNYQIGEKKILSSFSKVLKPGKIYGLMGKNGAGKTTLLRILDKIYPSNAGEIYINNYDISKYSHCVIMEYISYCSQATSIFPATIYDNIFISDKVRGKEITLAEEYIEDFGLKEVISALPKMNKTILEEDVKLSTGQYKKIQIIRTLIQDKYIMVFDEPSANLDEKSKEAFYKVLSEIKETKIVLIATNDKTCCRYVDEIIELPV